MFFYWSGHGVLEGTDQNLICKQIKENNIGSSDMSTGIRLGFINMALQSATLVTGVKVFIIIDACRKPLKEDLDENLEALLDKYRHQNAEELLGNGGRFLYSSLIKQNSFECDTLKSGVFTYFLLLGLKGGAAAPKTDYITYNGLRQFLNNIIPSYSRKYLKKDILEPDIRRVADGDKIVIIPKDIAIANKTYADELLSKIYAAPPVTAAISLRSLQNNALAK